MEIKEILNQFIDAKQGDFNDLSPFDFVGVYIIYKKDTNEIVYVGSAYARFIQTRLAQYLSETDTGNTLGKAVAKKLAKCEKYDDVAKKEISKAVSIIKSNFSIIAIPHCDLEYKLIKDISPIYNNKGKKED